FESLSDDGRNYFVCRRSGRALLPPVRRRRRGDGAYPGEHAFECTPLGDIFERHDETVILCAVSHPASNQPRLARAESRRASAEGAYHARREGPGKKRLRRRAILEEPRETSRLFTREEF